MKNSSVYTILPALAQQPFNKKDIKETNQPDEWYTFIGID